MSQPPPPPSYPPPSYPPPPPFQPPFPPYPPFPSPPPARRGRRVLAVVVALVVAVVVVAAAVLVPLVLADDESAVDTTNLDAVRSYDGLTNQHLSVGEAHDYPQSPAVGGDHAPVWLECGVYDEPVPEVNAVHDLEHGTTVVHYLPGLSEGDLRLLESKLPDNGIMAPYPGLRAPVVVTVWGRQLDLLGADDPRLELFFAEYGHGETAPEPFASCNGGLTPDQLPDSGVSA